MNKVAMKRHELWRLQYRQKRYMEHISQDDLDKRIEDVFRNSLTLTEEGKIGLRQISSDGEYWMIMWTHLLEEMSLRGSGIPHANMFPPETFPKTTWPHAPSAAKALKGREFEDGRYLFKYGKNEHLNQMVKNGVIKISPATFYNDASLNSAIKDDELILSVITHPDFINMVHIDQVTKEETIIKPTGNVTTTFELSTNYYVFCMSHICDFRLYDDFEADTCLIIKDVKGFLYRLNAAFMEQKGLWGYMADHVRYIDPLNPPKEKEIDLFFCKHFRYSYQKEIRAVWIPEKPLKQLEPIYLEIGSMDSYAELVEL